MIPKDAREKLNLTPGTVLRVKVEEKRVILEPLQEPPREVFVQAGPDITEPILRESKITSDKARRLLIDLGVSVD